MQCYNCKGEIADRPKSYQCKSCGLTIWKQIAGKTITPQIAEQLLSDGRTPLFKDFYSYKKKQHFSASLVIIGNKISFEYSQYPPAERLKPVKIRVQAFATGSVHIFFSDPFNKKLEVTFGLIPARLAECLGCITAVKYVRHQIKNVSATQIQFSLNNRVFTKYLLKEQSTRDIEMRNALDHLNTILRNFAGWRAIYKPYRRPQLKGNSCAKKFPVGIFPWLNAEVIHQNGNLVVKLPNTPEVNAQFLASIWRATPAEDGIYILPVSTEQALNAWMLTVKKEIL
jgi:hypothetical protein